MNKNANAVKSFRYFLWGCLGMLAPIVGIILWGIGQRYALKAFKEIKITKEEGKNLALVAWYIPWVFFTPAIITFMIAILSLILHK